MGVTVSARFLFGGLPAAGAAWTVEGSVGLVFTDKTACKRVAASSSSLLLPSLLLLLLLPSLSFSSLNFLTAWWTGSLTLPFRPGTCTFDVVLAPAFLFVPFSVAGETKIEAVVFFAGLAEDVLPVFPCLVSEIVAKIVHCFGSQVPWHVPRSKRNRGNNI
jgi:hypothetical protein